MKTKIVYDFQLDGHNMEYLHHLYTGAAQDTSANYIFVLPEEFEVEKKILEWPNASNITFRYFDIKKIQKKSDIYTSWLICRQLGDLIKEMNVDEILLVWMMNVVPFLPFFVPSKVKVSGIIYRIYLYTWKESSVLKRISDMVKYFVLSRSNCIKNVFILNDSSSASVLNRVWKSDKFKYLADPYVGFSSKDVRNLRVELKIPDDKIICLHFGAMSIRKGTLRILDMIDNANKERLYPYTFIFAGKVNPNIKASFYEKIEVLKGKAHIIVKDAFLTYEEIGSLMYTADRILLPYNLVDMSSGSIAYAAQFSKPVYVPLGGLLYKLVRKHKIGKGVKDFSDISYLDDNLSISSNYCDSHTVDTFNRTFLSL